MHMRASLPGSISIAEYERLPEEPEYRVELSRGRLVREPQPGALHGELTGRIYVALHTHVMALRLGKVTNLTGFALTAIPRTVRGPDVAFIRAERVPETTPISFWPFAPDLAVEVASPGNSMADLQEKAIEYLEAGTQLVWIVEPRTRSVTVYRSFNDIALLRESDVLSDPLLPGFSLSLAELFA